MAILTLLVIGLFCLAFKSTRMIGVMGLTLLMLMHPLIFLILFVVVFAIFYFIFKQRRTLNVYEQPKLPD